MSKGPPTIFVSLIFVPLFFVPHFCSADLLHLHLWSPPPNVQGSSNNFCSADFCSTVFVPHFCSTDLFALTPVVLHHPMSKGPLTIFVPLIFVLLFLFCIFVSLTFLHLLLGFPPPHVRESSNNFYSPMTFLHCPHQFLFPCLCSAFLFH